MEFNFVDVYISILICVKLCEEFLKCILFKGNYMMVFFYQNGILFCLNMIFYSVYMGCYFV